jgi:hypothetical protein
VGVGDVVEAEKLPPTPPNPRPPCRRQAWALHHVHSLRWARQSEGTDRGLPELGSERRSTDPSCRASCPRGPSSCETIRSHSTTRPRRPHECLPGIEGPDPGARFAQHVSPLTTVYTNPSDHEIVGLNVGDVFALDGTPRVRVWVREDGLPPKPGPIGTGQNRLDESLPRPTSRVQSLVAGARFEPVQIEMKPLNRYLAGLKRAA